MNISFIKKFLEESKFKHFHLWLIISLLFVVSFEGYDMAAYGVILPLVSKEWTLDPTVAGAIGSCVFFGMMFGSIILSSLADKIGLKKVLIISLVAYSIFTIVAAVAPNPWIFSLGRFVAGFGFGVVMPTSVAILMEYIPKSSRNKAIAFSLIGLQIGGILAPLMGIICIPSLGWRSVLWISALPLIVLPVLIKTIPELPRFLIKDGNLDKLNSILVKIDVNYESELNRASTTQSTENFDNIGAKAEKISVIGLFKNKLALKTIVFCIMVCMNLLVMNGVNTWLINLMMKNGYPLSSSLTFAIVLNIGIMIGVTGWGTLADKTRNKKILLCALYIVGAISLTLVGIKVNIFFMYFFIIVTGITLFATNSLLSAFIPQYYPDDIRATGLGFANGIGRFGGMIGPMLGGILISSNAPINVWFMVFALPGVIAAISFLLIKDKSE